MTTSDVESDVYEAQQTKMERQATQKTSGKVQVGRPLQRGNTNIEFFYRSENKDDLGELDRSDSPKISKGISPISRQGKKRMSVLEIGLLKGLLPKN